ncbi:ribonuclease H-like domain-containing protein [Tanacetum coccineum]
MKLMQFLIERNLIKAFPPPLLVLFLNLKKVGHTIDRCFDIIGYPPGYNKNSGPKQTGHKSFNANSDSSSFEKGATSSFTNEHMMKLMSLINEAPSGSVQANMADSGANQHMTISTLNMFGIINISDLNLTMQHPNGTLAKIKYVGNLRLSDKVVLFDVLVVPEYCDLLQNQIVGTANGGLFGHPSDQAVDMLQNDLNFTRDSKVSPCNICHKAKQTREPFPISDHQTTSIGELVHLDMWGPYKVISKEGSSDLLCLYPQQNGIAERKHRHLLNVARSLLFQSGLPLSMWTESILIVVYLINKLPSFVLDGKSPFELVYALHQKADFATSMGDNPSSEGNVLSSSSTLNIQNAQSLPENTSQVQHEVRRFSRTVKMPAKFSDYGFFLYGLEKYVTYSKLNTSSYCFFTNLNKYIEPTSYSKAVKNPHWIEAMNNEIKDLNMNNTWTICDLPIGRKPTGSKWLWKIKYKSSGEIERYKARMVAKGFSQRDGFDYLETFSHVVKIQWNAKLTMALLENGFVQSKFDSSLFTKKHDKIFIALLVYVNDIVITGNDVSEIEKFKIFLNQYMHAPLVSHLDVVLRVLRYLKCSPGSGIQIYKKGNLKLRAYADCDWAICPTIRKSVVEKRLKVVLLEPKRFILLSNVLIKALDIEQHKSLCVKLGMLDMLDMFKVEKLEEGC